MAERQEVVFVTGYPGFIGKRLVRRLVDEGRRRGARLVLLVQPRFAPAAAAELEALGAGDH